MSASTLVSELAAHGVHLFAVGDRLRIEGPREVLTDELARQLRDMKSQLLRVLSRDSRPWDASDWREYFEERVAVAMIDGEQPEAQARRIAWACCVTHWRALNPVASAPSHCAHCDRPDEPGNIVPFGTGPHVWLHGGCWEPWNLARQAEAERALRQTINGKGNYNVERD